MARAIWTGSISFGLVEIPVSLHTAESPEKEIRFHLLDRRNMKPVGYSRVNKETGKEVPWGDIVRAYEYEKGEYVVLADEELASANVEKSESIDIVGFVDLADIDPLFFDKPYYLKPLKKGSKGYALLREALDKTGKAGIAKVVLRTRQYVCAVVGRGPALTLVLLRYGDEIKSPASLEILPDKEAAVSAKEMALAEQLIDGMAMEWKPSEFHDTYREDVMDLIEEKIKSGKTEEVLVRERPKKKGAEVLDLMPLLKKSLESAGGGRPRKAAEERRAPARKKARKGA
jgi:DNA end-binding protein Ku